MTQNQSNQDDERTCAQPGNETTEPLADAESESRTSVEGGLGQRRSRGPQSGGRARTPSRRKRRNNGISPTKHADGEGIIELPHCPGARDNESQSPEVAAANEAVLGELEAQGFTEDEAYRLLDVSDRIANSRETREAEAVIRRLRFNRWLFEQGKLSEFSA